jgi:signal transduction histidine kinase
VTSTPGKGSTFTCHFPPRRLQLPGALRISA